MNKICGPMALAVLVISPLSHSEDGKISFNGNISDESCTLSSGDKDLAVDFGIISGRYYGEGKSRPQKIFNINLYNCPSSVSTAVVSWEGKIADYNIVPDPVHSLTLYNAGVLYTAAWWQIAEGNQLSDGVAQQMDNLVAFDSSPGDNLPIHSGNNELTYTASLIQYGGRMFVNKDFTGDFTGSATYSITYN